MEIAFTLLLIVRESMNLVNHKIMEKVEKIESVSRWVEPVERRLLRVGVDYKAKPVSLCLRTMRKEVMPVLTSDLISYVPR
jgi:hypothetical protein